MFYTHTVTKQQIKTRIKGLPYPDQSEIAKCQGLVRLEGQMTRWQRTKLKL